MLFRSLLYWKPLRTYARTHAVLDRREAVRANTLLRTTIHLVSAADALTLATTLAPVAERAFARVVYGTHPYGHLSLGDEHAIGAMGADAIRDMHQAMFVPAGATLVVVGARPEEELLDRAAAVFSRWENRPSPLVLDPTAPLAVPPPTPSARFGVLARAGAAQSELRIGYACARRATPDYHALLLLNTILGGDFVSRLNLNLREAKGYTYGASAGAQTFRAGGAISGGALRR